MEVLVKLTVYDALGKKITELVNQNQSAGTYSVKFDASEFASGIYYYKLQAGEFVQTRKMVLAK